MEEQTPFTCSWVRAAEMGVCCGKTKKLGGTQVVVKMDLQIRSVPLPCLWAQVTKPLACWAERMEYPFVLCALKAEIVCF